ncbi:hypothetical protein ACIBI4_22990 [Streptomyces sp. NPDC050418]|uniref:hypothetical protein n=1 Tax=Streptomyces sp. NPDC050418 TaxID=3365612 RepID=UPI00379A3A00
MGQPQILTRGARVTGSVASAAIALISAGWIVRDLYELESAGALWRLWAVIGPPPQTIPYSGLVDIVLFLVGSAVAVTAVRSSSAASSLVAVGILAVIARAPSVWLMMDVDRFDALDLRVRALASAGATVGLGVILLLLAAFGRRPAGESAGYSSAFGEDREPVRPTLGAARTTFVFLCVAALAGIAWEIYGARELGWEFYRGLLTGTGPLATPLSPPKGWIAWSTSLFALAATVAVLQRASFGRALGMCASAVYLAYGSLGIYSVAKGGLLDRFGDLSWTVRLDVLTAFWFALAGAITLVTLFFAFERRYEPQYGGWDPADGTYGPPPPSTLPPGW